MYHNLTRRIYEIAHILLEGTPWEANKAGQDKKIPQRNGTIRSN